MPQVHVDGPTPVDDLLGERRHHVRELAALQAFGVVLLHEALAARIDQPRAVRDRDVVAWKVELLHQHVERAAKGEFHIDQAPAGTKRHGGAIAAIVVDAMRALHRDHAGRYDRSLRLDDDEPARIDVEANGARDSGARRPLAVGCQQFGDEQAVENARATRRDLAAKLAHRDLRLILHAADIDHAAAREPADRPVGTAGDRYAPADIVLDALALAFQQLIRP